MNDKRMTDFADSLYNALVTKVPIPPLTELDDRLTIDDAYRIQMLNVERMTELGEVISGKKIGLTSEGIQKQLGVSEPDYGHLFSSMDHSAPGKLKFSDFVSPKIEGEIAFCLKEDLKGGSVTVEDVYRATEYVVPAFEIVDSRVADWKIKLVDTVSDNASSGAYVLGNQKTALSDVNLKELVMRLYKEDTLIAEGTGAAVLGDPCEAVAWLSNRLWSYGVVLKAGEIVLSGAFTAAPAAVKGDKFMADFGLLGVVKAEFI